jgi:AcrR family transcriptional regulator
MATPLEADRRIAHDEPSGGGEQRRRRADGERSHRAILRGATELATIEGLEGLSIARLASHIGMSKGGLYAHFGSKEELQLATVEEAQAIFAREVTRPALERPEGVAQVVALCDEFLSYLERRVFPGGCFFAAAAAELDTRDGRVKNKIKAFSLEWLDDLAERIRVAQRRGELDAAEDPEQVAFELDSLLHGANAGWVLFDDPTALERARTGIRRRLGLAA